MEIKLNSHQRKSLNLSNETLYMQVCSNKINQFSQYADMIRSRANIGNKVLRQNKNLVKIKFYIYLPLTKSGEKRAELNQRIRNLGGEVTYSINKPLNFLVVSDNTFNLSNDKLLTSSAILSEAVQSENNIAKNSAEKPIVE